MNKSILQSDRGQMGMTAFAIFFVICSGYILWQFTPTLDHFRVERISATDPTDVLSNLFLYLLIPVVWCGWLLISALLVLGTARGA